MKLALELPGRAVKRECALILESMKVAQRPLFPLVIQLFQQYNEAASLYEKGQFYDRAAAVCLKAKNW